MPSQKSSTITEAPAYKSDREPLSARTRYDFADYGFVISAFAAAEFEIVPVKIDDDEAFLFFFSREDIREKRYSLFNFHAFLRYSGSLENFAHSRGESVQNISMSSIQVFGVRALTYKRQILMSDLFKGAESVVDFIGGRPDLLVSDSHTYFAHRHNSYYSGMIHLPEVDAHYDELRRALFSSIELV